MAARPATTRRGRRRVGGALVEQHERAARRPRDAVASTRRARRSRSSRSPARSAAGIATPETHVPGARHASRSATRRSRTTGAAATAELDLRDGDRALRQHRLRAARRRPRRRDLVAQPEAFGFNDDAADRDPGEASLMPDPDRDDRVGDRVGGRRSARRRARQPPGPQATGAADGARRGRHRQRRRGHATLRRCDASPTQAGRDAARPTRPADWTTRPIRRRPTTVTRHHGEVVRPARARARAIPGVSVAGKTGTAEAGKDVRDARVVHRVRPCRRPRRRDGDRAREGAASADASPHPRARRYSRRHSQAQGALQSERQLRYGSRPSRGTRIGRRPTRHDGPRSDQRGREGTSAAGTG